MAKSEEQSGLFEWGTNLFSNLPGLQQPAQKTPEGSISSVHNKGHDNADKPHETPMFGWALELPSLDFTASAPKGRASVDSQDRTNPGPRNAQVSSVMQKQKSDADAKGNNTEQSQNLQV